MHKIHLLFYTLSLNVLDAQYLPQIMHGYFNSESSPKLVLMLALGVKCRLSLFSRKVQFERQPLSLATAYHCSFE